MPSNCYPNGFEIGAKLIYHNYFFDVKQQKSVQVFQTSLAAIGTYRS